ncbi:MAG: PD40 domain-containing protein [Anaerolineaceae bacterium]|nr:PD40 domain-containing protein [Anaerolineaceae bacterium]
MSHDRQQFCAFCGQPNTDEARFCGNCGRSLAQTSPIEGRQRGLIALAVYGVVIVILLLVAWLWLKPTLQLPETGVLANTGSNEVEPEIDPIRDTSTAVAAVTATITLTPEPSETAPPTSTLRPTSTIVPTMTTTPIPSPTTPPSPTPWPPEIVFQSNRDGDFEIYIMHADGSNQRQLTFNNVADQFPRVSPDDARIVFESERDGNPEIYVMNRDGSQQTRLTANPANDRLPAWSPDGNQITFQSFRTGNAEIYVMNADGSDVRRVTTTGAIEGHTSWSANNLLVFNASEPNQNYWQIYTSDLAGNNRQKLTNTRIDEWSPEWSPDGTQILFLSERDSSVNSGIYMMEADGSNVRLLYNSPTEEWGPAWSADGNQIVFTVDQPDGTADIYIMNADGSNVRQLIERGGYPSWAQSLTASTTNVSSGPNRILRLTEPYMTGEDVTQLQQRLFDLGYTLVGEIDGIFGPLTEAAVKEYQANNNLEVDGIVGPDTWTKLFETGE